MAKQCNWQLKKCNSCWAGLAWVVLCAVCLSVCPSVCALQWNCYASLRRQPGWLGWPCEYLCRFLIGAILNSIEEEGTIDHLFSLPGPPTTTTRVYIYLFIAPRNSVRNLCSSSRKLQFHLNWLKEFIKMSKKMANFADARVQGSDLLVMTDTTTNKQ